MVLARSDLLVVIMRWLLLTGSLGLLALAAYAARKIQWSVEPTVIEHKRRAWRSEEDRRREALSA